MRQFFAVSLLIILHQIPGRALAQGSSSSPYVMLNDAGQLVTSNEICGDSIDQDGDGKDTPCTGPDFDRDGYVTNDCDNYNRYVYPSISVSCDTSCGRGWKTCQPNGQYSSCTCAPLCESTGTGRCFYISALSGDDTNNGSFTSPWRSLRNITHYHYTETPPTTWVPIKPGDVIYLMNGIYSDVFATDNTKASLFFRGANGSSTNPITIQAYPGHSPIISPRINTQAVRIFQASWINLKGLEITNSYSSGISIQESHDVTLEQLHIQKTDGIDNDNIAGLYIGSVDNLTVHHSFIHDNFDRTNADTNGQKTENSSNVVLFAGKNISLEYNVLFQTPDTSASKTGGCVKYKHAAITNDATFNINHNVFINCAIFGVGSGTQNTSIFGNIFYNSDNAVSFRDWGGPTHLSNMTVVNNTFINSNALSLTANENYSLVGNLKWTNNVVVDSAPYSQDRGVLSISPYGTDEQYARMIAGNLFTINNNCYFNVENYSLVWNAFAVNGGTRGLLGKLFTLSEWKTLGFDRNSYIEDPLLDTSQIPSNPVCTNAGWSSAE